MEIHGFTVEPTICGDHNLKSGSKRRVKLSRGAESDLLADWRQMAEEI